MSCHMTACTYKLSAWDYHIVHSALARSCVSAALPGWAGSGVYMLCGHCALKEMHSMSCSRHECLKVLLRSAVACLLPETYSTNGADGMAAINMLVERPVCASAGTSKC